MAHKKGVGSSKNGRESESKRLGVKLFGGELAKAGNIIVRQRGTQHHPGENTGIGKDHTIYALVDGTVVFRKTKNNRSFISIQSLQAEPATKLTPDDAVETLVAESVSVEPIVETVVEAMEAPVIEIELPSDVEASVPEATTETEVAVDSAGEAETILEPTTEE